MKNHGALSKWLMQEEQKELFEFLLAALLNVAFLALTALLLWPPGRLMLSLRLAKGYGIFWVVMGLTFVLLYRIQRMARVNIYDHPDAFVISNLTVSCFLQAGWSAFAALTVQSFVPGASGRVVVLLYFVGVLSCLIAFFVVSSFYQGHVYKFVNLPLALLSFIVSGVWPASGRLIYGWFFDLFY